MTIPFRLLRDALTNLALPPERQRQQLAGTAVTDELALDLDNALLSLNYEMERVGIQLAPALVTAAQQLLDTLAAPPADDSGTTPRSTTTPSGTARRRASKLLTKMPPT